jgi:hypothetical protein
VDYRPVLPNGNDFSARIPVPELAAHAAVIETVTDRGDQRPGRVRHRLVTGLRQLPLDLRDPSVEIRRVSLAITHRQRAGSSALGTLEDLSASNSEPQKGQSVPNQLVDHLLCDLLQKATNSGIMK